MTLALLVGAPASAQSAQLEDPMAMGPHVWQVTEYGSDSERYTYNGIQNEFWGRVFFPTDLDNGPYPLVIALHGQHKTCAGPNGAATTDDWPCASPNMPVPSLYGFDYFAANLASWGVFVVSISANGLTVGSSATSDAARESLIRDHLGRWYAYNLNGDFAPFPFEGLPSVTGELEDSIDLSRVGLLGHSRGGAGIMRTAANALPPPQDPWLFKALLAIAPVGSTPVNNIPVSSLLSYCDGDTEDLPGVRLLDNVRYNVSTDPAEKYTYVIPGGNHNAFNAIWSPEYYLFGGGTVIPAHAQGDDALDEFAGDSFCDASVSGNGRINGWEQRSVASAYILSFFRRHLLGERQFDAYLQGDLPPPPSTSTNKVKVSYHPPSAERRDVNRLDTQSVFDAERNTLNGVTTDTGLTPYTLCDGSDCLSQTRTGNSYLRLGLGWNSLTASYANAIPSGSRDVSDFATLQFRVGVDHTDSRNGGTARNFRVQLRDGAGDTATARVADFSNALLFPPGGTSSRMSLMSTVRIPVVAFDNIDLDNIVSVNFLFNEQSTGKIFVSDLAFADHGVAGGYWMGNDSRGFSAFDVALGKQFRPFSGNFDDANGDDIFLYAPGSATDLMLWSNGDGTFTTEVVNVGGFYLPIAGDFDGDQADDIFWYAPGSTTDYIWWSDGDRTFTSSTQNVAGDYKPFAGDFDGDGATDIFWYVPGSTADSIWWSDGDRTFTSVSQSVSGTYSPAVGDFDGNGRDDIFWYAPGSASDGIWWWNANRTFTTTAPSVGGTYQLFTGDFDDDGFDDIFWYRPGSASDAVWWWSASRTYVSTTQSVSGTYKIAAGDFDDDGNSDIFWYAP